MYKVKEPFVIFAHLDIGAIFLREENEVDDQDQDNEFPKYSVWRKLDENGYSRCSDGRDAYLERYEIVMRYHPHMLDVTPEELNRIQEFVRPRRFEISTTIYIDLCGRNGRVSIA